MLLLKFAKLIQQNYLLIFIALLLSHTNIYRSFRLIHCNILTVRETAHYCLYYIKPYLLLCASVKPYAKIVSTELLSFYISFSHETNCYLFTFE